ncbi:hypothetical protein, partial [Acinetobacter baumannii]|uniref:hypothetical protein n=1 Tax=Acinetobacter baumannii TaxID=470 RepID=UPI00331C56F0
LKGVVAGLLCLALLIALAAMRHANVRPDLAPITEWLLFAAGIWWLTFVYYTATAPNNASKPTPLRGAA